MTEPTMNDLKSTIYKIGFGIWLFIGVLFIVQSGQPLSTFDRFMAMSIVLFSVYLVTDLPGEISKFRKTTPTKKSIEN